MKLTKLMVAATTLATFAATTGTVSADEMKSYTIKSGDTLAQIAEDHFGSVDYVNAIAKVNNIENVNLIYTGEVLQFEKVKETYDSGVKGLTINYQTTYQTPTATNNVAQAAPTYAAGGSVVLSNGNTAGELGSQAAAVMAARTGVDQATWENIIARESNGQLNAYNPSGASGLFQTMPGWGSTATFDDQIEAATRAYNAQGLSAWGF